MRRTLTLMAILLAGLLSCDGSPQPKRVAAARASADGFRVVVIQRDEAGATLSAACIPIPDAQTSMNANPSSAYLVPVGGAQQIERLLIQSEGKSGDFSVDIDAQPPRSGEQLITVGLHYSARTIRYCYRASGKSVTPLWSSQSNLGGTSKTEYISDK